MNSKNLPQFLAFAKRKKNDNASVIIYVRITYEKQVYEKSTGISCAYQNWESSKTQITGNKSDTHRLKLIIDEITQKFMGTYYLLVQQKVPFNISEIVEVANGERQPGALSFCQCFQDIIGRMEKMQGYEGNSLTNLQKHKRCLAYFIEFCKTLYNKSDLSFSRITRRTLDELVDYFKTVMKCEHNTTMKYMAIIKKVYRAGMDNGWVVQNAFANFRFKMKVVDRDFLSEDELFRIQNKEFGIARLNHVRDFFIFSCFTGLAYIDLKKLTRKNITENNGIFLIKSRRTKTGIEASVPLLAPAKAILDRHRPNWQVCTGDTILFEVISNQRLNAYLKEIADVCNIDKIITFHLARHTFATTVTLCNDIPLETVSKMLGHSRITMTQHYSKVIDSKIFRDTEKLQIKFNTI